MAALVVAMSIGRFAYTPILPVMIAAGVLTHQGGAFLASANLLGYLIGAVLASTAWSQHHRIAILRWSLALAVLTTAAMAAAPSMPLWLAARVLCGIASAFILILAAALVLDLRKPAYAAAFFSAVGIGIVITGALVPFVYQQQTAWQSGWIAIALLALVLALLGAVGMRESRHADARPPAPRTARTSLKMGVTLAAYAVAGFSYVIPATFLIAIVQSSTVLRPFSALTWIVVGAVSALSTLIWGPLADRFGRASMLGCVMVLMALAAAAPLFQANAAGPLVAAFALGASFIPSTLLTVRVIRELEPHSGNRRIGQATALFGIGQVMGPVLTGLTYARGGYAPSFLAAAGLAFAAALAVWAVDQPRFSPAVNRQREN